VEDASVLSNESRNNRRPKEAQAINAHPAISPIEKSILRKAFN
jgi:hypothetical protein